MSPVLHRGGICEELMDGITYPMCVLCRGGKDEISFMHPEQGIFCNCRLLCLQMCRLHSGGYHSNEKRKRQSGR